MAVGVLEIDAAAAVVAVDLAGLLLAGVGPVVELAFLQAGEDAVEVLFADQEGVVLPRDLAIDPVEVERDAVVEFDDQERPEARRLRPPENLGQESCRCLPVAAPDDGVVEGRSRTVSCGSNDSSLDLVPG